MSSKVIDVRAGNKWTKCSCGIGGLYLYRDGSCLYINKLHAVSCVGDSRLSCERDIPTPEALAQLREWGYEVRGEEPATSTVMSNGTVIETRYSAPVASPFRPVFGRDILCTSNWAGPEFTPPLTESRVIEIVESVLAKRSHTGHYSLAPDDARVREIVTGMLAAQPPRDRLDAISYEAKGKPRINLCDGDTWREYGGTLVQVRGGRCRNCEPTEVGEWFDSVFMRNRPEVFPATAICRLAAMGYSFDDMTIGAGSASKAPPPPDVDAEPDWKGLLERVCDAADFVIDTDETPESNCSCHIDPPCLDCEEYAGRRQAIDELNAALAAARRGLSK